MVARPELAKGHVVPRPLENEKLVDEPLEPLVGKELDGLAPEVALHEPSLGARSAARAAPVGPPGDGLASAPDEQLLARGLPLLARPGPVLRHRVYSSLRHARILQLELTIEYVKRWFTRNVPRLAGTVTGVIVNPLVGMLVGAAGDAVVREFFRP